jgi:hypothetical protein
MTEDEARIVSLFYGGTMFFFACAISASIWMVVWTWRPLAWPLRALRFGLLWPPTLFFPLAVAKSLARLVWDIPVDRFDPPGTAILAGLFLDFVLCGVVALGWIIYHSAFRPSVFNRTQKAPRQSNHVAARHLASGWRWIWTTPIRWIARLTRAVKQEWDAASRD